MVGNGSNATGYRLLFVLLGAYFGTYLVIFFFGVIVFPARDFLSAFRAEWTVSESFIRFMRVLPAIHVSAILLTCSFSPPAALSVGFARSMIGTIMVFLSLTVVYAVFVEGLEPAARATIDRLGYQTRMSRVLLDRARDSFEAGRYQESRGLLEYYREIDPGNRDAAELAGSVTRRLADEIASPVREPEAVRKTRKIELSPAQLISRAADFLESDDPFSAYYYARLAGQAASSRGETWRDADRIAALAAGRIEALELSETEQEEAELYSMKQRGIEALSSGDPAMQIEGYYLFEELSRTHSDDREVKRYLAEAIETIAEVSFFLDRALEIVPMPGSRNIIFLDPAGAEDEYRLVYLGKLVRLEQEVYIEQVEVIGLSRDGELRYRYRAPYAELLSGVLILQGIDRGDPSRTTGPIGVDGEPWSGAVVLAISPTLDELDALAGGESQYAVSGFLTMVDLAGMLRRYGFDPAPVVATALGRITAPFSFFVLSLLAVAFGIRLAPERGRPSTGSLILVPAVPVALFALLELVGYAGSLLHAYLAIALRFDFALLVVTGIETLLVIASVFFLATSQIPTDA